MVLGAWFAAIGRVRPDEITAPFGANAATVHHGVAWCADFVRSAPDHPEQAGMDLVQDAGGRPCSQAATQGGTGPVGQRSKTRPGAARSSRHCTPHAGKNGGWQRRLWWLLEDGRVPETAAGSRRSGEQSDQQAKWAGFLNSIRTPSDGKDAAPINQHSSVAGVLKTAS
jgi:hypothetical protein